MRHLSIDIETYSSVDLKKSGLFKYVEAPDFQILLLAYSYNGEPVQILDFAKGCNSGGDLFPNSLYNDLKNSQVVKHAYNAPFEIFSLAKFFRWTKQQTLDFLPQWRCTMLHGLYCGYPAGLALVGKTLGLAEEKLKMSTGKALIRTFCAPVKPTRTNGQRTRTLPTHEPERWELFKDYCKQDVVTEMQVEQELSYFPVPDEIQAQWEQDQRINYAGVAVDFDLVTSAIVCDEQVTKRDTDKAKVLTGLNNPNSRAQMLKWLNSKTETNIPNLQKETVEELLKTETEPIVLEALELWQQLSRTSVTKYQAMMNTVCTDGRIRGLLQFYGANRTGRWAGRLVQPQNLPRTYIKQVDLAQQITKIESLSALELTFGSAPDTLSQLIRTSLIATEGKTLISADFSAIEARVIAWLAGEQWRLNVFSTHGKIYEASASQMFGVPLERITKGNPEYALRQKGKVAELALGYQGSSGALKQMGALNMGLDEEELPDIVSRWRAANPRIVDLWYAIDAAVVDTVQTGRTNSVKGIVFCLEGDPSGKLFLTIDLPAGRKLYYAQPHMGLNRWDRPSVCYWERFQGNWAVSETYGGKLTENIIQAIARDCLAIALTRVENAGYKIIFHVHDEIIVETKKETAEADLQHICDLMGEPIPWAEGLKLSAEGYISPYFKKD